MNYEYERREEDVCELTSQTYLSLYQSLLKLEEPLKKDALTEKEILACLWHYRPFLSSFESVTFEPFSLEERSRFTKEELLLRAIESFSLYAMEGMKALSSLFLSIRYVLSL